ncbi:MAG: BspA family leucine-rich repeat surface protein [Bacteroidota bacterium]
MKTKLLAFLLCIVVYTVNAQTTYTYNGSGNWTNAANWSPSYPGTTIAADAIVTGNGGTVTIDQALGINSGATLTFASGAFWVDPSSGLLDHFINGHWIIGTNTTMTFTNSRIFNNSSGSFTNNGTLDADDLILANSGLVINNATINLPNGFSSRITNNGPNVRVINNVTGFINNQGSIFSGGVAGGEQMVFTNYGTWVNNNTQNSSTSVSIKGTIHNYGSMSFSNNAPLKNSGNWTNYAGSQLNINTGSSLENTVGSMTFNDGATFTANTATITNNIPMTQNAGATFQVTGTTTFNNNNNINIYGAASFGNGVNFTNSGTANLSVQNDNSNPSFGLTVDGTLTNNGTIENFGRLNVNGIINQNSNFGNQANAEVNITSQFTNSGFFTNEIDGNIRITGAGNFINTATYTNLGFLSNEAIITETSPINFDFDGTVSGVGTHSGNSTHSGTIAPGTATNLYVTYNFNNNLNTNTFTTIALDIRGTSTGFAHDQINVAGAAVIDGTLNVNLPLGVTPDTGDSFTLISAGSISGTFENVNLPQLSIGQQWNLAYGATAITLTLECYSGARIYVNTNATGANTGESWTDAFTSLQDAIEVANACNVPEIWVAQGTYYPSAHPRDVTIGTLTDRDFTFHLVDGTKMYGGFAGTETTLSERDFINNPTILSGDIGVQGDTSDNTYHVVSSFRDADTTILDGFTVENGVGGTTSIGITSEGVIVGIFSGAGIVNVSTETMYENLIIQNNQAINGGGIFNQSSNITANNIVLINNMATSDGGAMSIFFSSPIFQNILVANNTGSTASAISHLNTTPTYNNATFYNNISTDSSNPHAITNLSSIPTFNNSVTFGQPFDFSFTSGGTVQGSNNYTSQNPTEYGSPAGFTHLTTDPFANSTDIDGPDNILRTADDGLVGLYSSVLHQAGNNTFTTLATDITEQPRIVETLVDIGAYEQQNTVIVSYFVTTWKTDNPGTSNSTEITIPTRSGLTYNYDVDWDNDGTFDDIGVTGDSTHTYASAGTYTIAIRGTFPAILFNGGGDSQKILSVEQWGTIPWQNFDSAFSGCINLVDNSVDTPNLSNVFDMGFAFSGCTSFTSNTINNWNVSNVTRFRGMFTASSFNQSLNNWNLSSAIDMSSMFFGSPFNQPLSNWNMNGVQNIQSMFRATPFDQDISMWDTSTINNMGQLFFGCPFNQDISGWNVSSVTSMLEMFKFNGFFDQDIGGWNVSNVVSMRGMFQNATFDQDISQWNVSMVSDMFFMFQGGGLSIENYDALLIAWSQLPLQNDVYFSGGNSTYCYGTEALAAIATNFNWTFDDGGQGNCPVLLSPKAYLQGAYINLNPGANEDLMRDDLRAAGLIPTTSPYADMLTCEASVFTTTGADAIVDWVWVELRDATDNTAVITGQSALLQRDGDIVDVDGDGELLMNAPLGDYFVVVKHRNHLGVMSANTLTIDYTSTSVDFSNPSTPTFGTNAQTTPDSPLDVAELWAGNANGDTLIQYSGTDPDAPSILSLVLNDAGNFLNFPTYVVNGYSNDDLDMNGQTQYSGTNPDTPFILQNVLAHPGNFLNFSTYQIVEQLPEN